MSLSEFKIAWLDAVHAYSKPTSVDLHVAHSIFEKYAKRVGLSFAASQSDIANEAGVTRRGFQKVLKRLIDHGLLQTTGRAGPSKPSEYTLVLK